ncbi:MAG: NADH-quinone oxidoreductase subunit A [Vicinamibacteria bacterium]|nr:NADH-quinone oxidoreductase subunit A [Vicinamibacteria bacterium]
MTPHAATSSLPPYFPVVMLFLAATGFALFNVILSWLLGRPRPNAAKSSVYECGVPSVAKLSERFPIKFYLVAMLFILFDVDAAFLYPWALVFKELGLFGFVEMMIFMGLLGAGFAYAWKSGAFEW